MKIFNPFDRLLAFSPGFLGPLMRRLFSFAIATFMALGAQAAENAQVGQQLTAQCAACHGIKRLATLAHAPNLAGQPLQYLAEQLKLLRSGKRQNETMNLMAKPLTDQQIEDIASWYNTQAIQLIP